MSGPLILSVFPGIDLLGRAFEEEWPEACIVRGPDLLWGGDIKLFHPPAGRFDGLIGGPPCQKFSRLRFMVERHGYKTKPDLIPEFERCAREAEPSWFLMENVPAAPLPKVAGYVVRDELIRDIWVGGVTDRLRRFSFGTRDGRALIWEHVALHLDPEPSALASGGGRPVPIKIGGSGKVKRSALVNYGYKTRGALVEHLRKQGLPPDFLAGAPFTVRAKVQIVGEGVPLSLGRAIARAVKRALT